MTVLASFSEMLKRRFGPLRQQFNRQIEKVAIQFRIQNAVASAATGAPNKQLMIVNIDGDMFRNVL